MYRTCGDARWHKHPKTAGDQQRPVHRSCLPPASLLLSCRSSAPSSSSIVLLIDLLSPQSQWSYSPCLSLRTLDFYRYDYRLSALAIFLYLATLLHLSFSAAIASPGGTNSPNISIGLPFCNRAAALAFDMPPLRYSCAGTSTKRLKCI